MDDRIDARGLACPQPVLLVRKALQGLAGQGVLSVLVGDEAARDNVRRFAQSQGCRVTADVHEEGGWALRITKGGASAVEGSASADGVGGGEQSTEPAPLKTPDPAAAPRLVVYLNAETVGRGDEELGRVLMHAFLGTFREVEPLLDHLILVHGAVRVNVKGHPLVEDLEALARLGVEVLTCGTCVDFYGLKGAIAVGRLTNTFEVASLLARAERVVRP